MKKLNEDVVINDPGLAQQYANGQTQLLNKDKQINALQKQINSIEQSKNEIARKMAEIEKKSAQSQPDEVQQQLAQQQVASQAQVAATSESLIIKENEEYSNYLEDAYNALTDELVMLQQLPISKQSPDHDKLIWHIKREISELDSELNTENSEQEDNWDSNGYKLSEKNEDNPLSVDNFYDLSEAYVDDITFDNKEYNEEEFLFYVRITDNHNEFIGKIFKMSPDGEWYGIIKDGEDDSFEKISYDASYDEQQIVDFLQETYDEVEIIDINEFNNYIEGDTDDLVVKDIEESGVSGMNL